MSSIRVASLPRQAQPGAAAQPAYTLAQARERLGVGRGVFYALVAAGHIRSVPVLSGRFSVYVAADVDHQAATMQAAVRSSLTVAEALKRLGVCHRTFYAWLRAGEIHRVEVPGQPPRYALADVDRLIEQQHTWRTTFPQIPAHEGYTPHQAQAVLGFKKAALYRHEAAGRLHRVRLSTGGVGYRQAEIHALRDYCQRRWAVPAGSYTLAQALQVVGLSQPGFEYHVLAGKVRRVSLPESQCAGYVIEDVLALRDAIQRRPPCPPDSAAYTAFYEAFVPLGIGALQRRGVSAADAQDIVQRVMLELWEYGAPFFAQFPTFDEQRPMAFCLLRWERSAWYRERSTHATVSLEHEDPDEDWQREAWRAARQPSVEQEVLGRERIAEMRAYCQRRFPKAVQVIMELTMMSYTYQDIKRYLQDHELASWGQITIEKQRAKALTDIRAYLGVTEE